jgi:hypothetical protein
MRSSARKPADVKIFKKLGKSQPKKSKVRKRSKDDSVKLDMNKIPPSEIYKEAIENISNIKETFCTSKDMSRSQLKFEVSDIKKENDETPIKKEEEEVQKKLESLMRKSSKIEVNESFGDPRSRRSSNQNSAFRLKDITGNEDISQANQRSFLTSDNHTINILKDSRIPTSERDPRLDLILKIMNLENLTHIFYSNNLTFNDLLLLSKEDLIEMGVSLVPRNRIMNFNLSYKNFAKDFTYEELLDFFPKNKNFVFCRAQSPLEEKTNEDINILSTANFHQEMSNILQNKNVNEVYSGDNTSENPQNNKLLNSDYSLANYVVKERKNNFYSSKTHKLGRSESEEKAIQTKEIDAENELHNIKVMKRKNNNSENILSQANSNNNNNNCNINTINTITSINSKSKDDQLKRVVSFESEKLYSTKEMFIDENTGFNNDDINQNCFQKEELDVYPVSLVEDRKQNSNIIHNKTKNINIQQKKSHNMRIYDNISNQVENYIQSYKEHKAKSDDRLNRLKCLIQKSKRRRSKSLPSRSKSKVKSESNLHLTPQEMHDLEINENELNLEEERNLHEEMNKLMNRIQSPSRNSLQQDKMKIVPKTESQENINKVYYL